jgi:NADPH2:quinone reductase
VSVAPTAEIVRAARLKQVGKPLVIEEVELTPPAEGEVRIDLAFGGVNPIDRYIAEGRVAPDAKLPRTSGGEASGTVDGQPVMVAGSGLGTARDGVWAQAANVPAAAAVPIPDAVDLKAAAAMGIAGLTALECVRNLAIVDSGDRVLVLGASGGVGSMVVSLAKAAGAVVWGQTGSEEKVAKIAEHGASRVLVGGPDDLARPLTEFQPTVVFDPLGDGFVSVAVEALAPRGRLVSLGVSAGAEVTFNMQSVYRNMASILGYGGMQLTEDEHRTGLEAALKAVQDGELKVRIDHVLGLDQVNEAFERLADRRVQGNLLLDLG